MPVLVVLLSVLLNLAMALLGVLSPAALAQDLADTEAALSRGEYTQSRRMATEAIQAGTRTAAELIAPYRLLALSCGYLDQADAATRAFVTLLALDPTYRIQDGLPVEVRSPYMDARGFWSAHVQRLSAELAFSEDGSALMVRVHDPAGVSARVRIRARMEGSSQFVELVRPPSEGLSLSLEGLSRANQVEYAITLLDEHGNRVWQIGSDTQPLRLARQVSSQVVGTTASPPRSLQPISSAPSLGSGRTRRRPYLVVGSTLLAIGVGAGAVGGLAHAKREQLAGRWNRGDCDGPGTTRGTICASEDKDIEGMTQLAVGLYSSGAVALISGLTLLLLAPSRADDLRSRRVEALAWRCSQGAFRLGLLCSRGF